MSTTFGNNLERPCVDCGGHPLRAVHDRNGAAFTHYYVPPAEHEQSAPDGEEWRVEHFTRDGADEWMVVTGATGRSVALANTNDSRLAESEMRQIVRDHRLAALVPGLEKALREAKGLITERHFAASKDDFAWAAHRTVTQIDAALNAVAKEREQGNLTERMV